MNNVWRCHTVSSLMVNLGCLECADWLGSNQVLSLLEEGGCVRFHAPRNMSRCSEVSLASHWCGVRAPEKNKTVDLELVAWLRSTLVPSLTRGEDHLVNLGVR